MMSTLGFLHGQAELASVDSTRKNIQYSLRGGVTAATATPTPFWLRSNQFGVVPKKNPNVFLSGSIMSDYTKKNWDWGYGIETWINLGSSSSVIVPQAYIKAKYKRFEILGGRQKQIIGIVGDSSLTSGSYIQSGNSIPIPMIQIGFTNYVPLLKGLVAFKGFINHGWFDANAVVRNHYSHQKAFYLRLGKDKWPVAISGGFNHNVQWGGTVITSNRWTVGKKNPQDWIDYWYVFTGKSIPTFGYVDPTKYDLIDRGNRVGNHLGSIDVALEIRSADWNLMFYRQSFYDDGSLYQKANIRDGLNGVTLKLRKPSSSKIYLRSLLFEYLYTVSQGGNSFDLDGGPRGRDNYFNHTQFEGWVYQENTIGTPFITPKIATRQDLPQPSVYFFSNNNRVKVFHAGIAGQVNQVSVVAKVSYSKNLGIYDRPFPEGINQTSAMLDLNFPLRLGTMRNLNGKIVLASDIGKLYKNSTGVSVSVIKRGFL
ncbi:capsule assembly Wzi family protein [Dyadobacter chenhuakuii]|uniref:Capsule assembly Wzi family protein n=1 Tax=Dyadobacter chenhuakuii TaxID=2909339 RepID=A0A9X1TWX0_9BACT|nr:capsule assembly Wzi family protein [Dyadobacter chenhuakuii]MCF2501517.1 capsule assembly Wzi family protein [Dyadobacter chenhuakuii]